MADVIIKGMEMPENCYSCDIRFGFACPAREGKRIQQVYARPDWLQSPADGGDGDG